MKITNTSDTHYAEKLLKAQTFFGDRTVVSRKELLEYQVKTGEVLPSKFWNQSRVGRGLFAITNTGSHSKPIPNVVPIHANLPKINEVNNKFDYEKLIPEVSDTYVEWGNYRDVHHLVKSNKFFTLYITGESGSGKNEMINQVAAKTKRPVVRVNITRDTKEEHLIGSKTLQDGNILYEEGPVKWCAENGAILVLDELSLGDANEIMCLQAVLEGKPFFVKAANVMVHPKPGFCIIATDNTKGRGSESGRYIGTNILNDAFLERFEMTMEQGYPTEKVEREIIKKLMDANSITDNAFENSLVKWVQAIRKTYIDEGIEEQITTRRACHIVNVFAKIGNITKAISLCTNRFDETTRMAMLSLWNNIHTESKLEAL